MTSGRLTMAQIIQIQNAAQQQQQQQGGQQAQAAA